MVMEFISNISKDIREFGHSFTIGLIKWYVSSLHLAGTL